MRGELLSTSIKASDLFDAEGRALLYAPGLPLEIKAPTDAAVKMAIIDSGIDRRHPQLAHLVVAERDFTGTGMHDSIGHGTAVALQSLLGQSAEMKEAHAFPIIVAKVADLNVGPTVDGVVQAIDWAVQQGADVVNLSLGFRADSLPDGERKRLCAAIARHAHVIFVAAAGNFGPSVKMLPASCGVANVLAVGDATDKSGLADIHSVPRPLVKAFAAHIEEAREALKHRNYAAAEKSYKLSLAGGPSAEAYLQLGLICAAEHRNAEAAQYLSEGTRAYPHEELLYSQLGAVLILLERRAEAEGVLRHALALKPDDVSAMHNLGIVLVQLGKFSAGVQALRKVKALNPGYPGIDEQIAEVLAFEKAKGR